METENGSKVSWEAFHHEWAALQETLRQRDREHLAALLEIRDALGSLRNRFDALPCGRHGQRLDGVEADLAGLKQRTINWRAAVRWMNRRTLLGAVGAVLTWLGWDSAAKSIVELSK